jgi:Wzt-like putative exopolysaccharide export protein
VSGSARKERIFQSVALLDEAGHPTNFVPLGGRPVPPAHRLEASAAIEYPHVTVGIDDTLGQRLLSLVTPLSKPVLERLAGRCEVECRVNNFPVAPGEYWLKLGLATMAAGIDDVERVLHFSVINGDAFGEGRGIHRGVCFAPAKWSVVEKA